MRAVHILIYSIDNSVFDKNAGSLCKGSTFTYRFVYEIGINWLNGQEVQKFSNKTFCAALQLHRRHVTGTIAEGEFTLVSLQVYRDNA